MHRNSAVPFYPHIELLRRAEMAFEAGKTASLLAKCADLQMTAALSEAKVQSDDASFET
jgi:hypothetical protein